MSRVWVKVPYDCDLRFHDELLLTAEEWDAISSLPTENEMGDDERQQALAELAKAGMNPFDFTFGTRCMRRGRIEREGRS